MVTSQELPDIELDQQSESFLKWTIEKYHHEVDWQEIQGNFDKTAEFVRRILSACTDQSTLGSPQLRAICHSANLTLTRSRLRQYIREFDFPEEVENELVQSVPEKFGVVGGPPMEGCQR